MTQNKSAKGEVIETVASFAGTVIAILLVSNFLLLNARIPSASMETTIMTGDRIFGNRLAYKHKSPERYDIVIFRFPDDESQLFIKRVIGLPGDEIDIRGGNVYVNGEKTREDFCITENSTDEGLKEFPVTVPEDSYFLMGDNRENSDDSRYWDHTFATKEQILAKAWIRYWPFNKIGKIQ